MGLSPPLAGEHLLRVSHGCGDLSGLCQPRGLTSLPAARVRLLGPLSPLG
jgi:hypothetical protein